MPDEIKKIEVSNRLFRILSLFLIGLLALWVVQMISLIRNMPGKYPREITVSAEGKAFAKPDIAMLKIGVMSEGMKIENLVRENTDKMNEILKEIKAQGIEEKDIETVTYNLSPRYDWLEGKRLFRGYTLNHEIRVKVRKFDKIGAVLEKSTERGANLIGELQFSVDDLEKVKALAIQAAIAKAKEKARTIAQQSGLRLGRIVNVWEEYSPIPMPAYGYKNIGIGGEAISAAPEIQPGQQEITVKMNLVYRLR